MLTRRVDTHPVGKRKACAVSRGKLSEALTQPQNLPLRNTSPNFSSRHRQTYMRCGSTFSTFLVLLCSFCLFYLCRQRFFVFLFFFLHLSSPFFLKLPPPPLLFIWCIPGLEIPVDEQLGLASSSIEASFPQKPSFHGYVGVCRLLRGTRAPFANDGKPLKWNFLFIFPFVSHLRALSFRVFCILVVKIT